MKKKLAVMLAVASIASAGSAMAATIYNVNGSQFNTYDAINAPTVYTTTNAYKIAYEVYNNTAGATTIAGDGTSFGQLNVGLTQPLVQLQNVNFVVSNGTAVFNSAGPGFNRYGVCRLRASALGAYLVNGTATSADIAGAVCVAGDIVATMPPSGVTTNNLGLQVINANATPIGAAASAANVPLAAAVTGLAARMTTMGPAPTAGAITFFQAAVTGGGGLLPTYTAAVTGAAGVTVATYNASAQGIAAANLTTLVNALTTVNELTQIPLITTAVNTLLAANTTTAAAPANSVVRLVQWNDNGAGTNDSQLGADEALTNGASIFVNAGLNPTCSTSPVIQMTFSSSGGESTALPINFAYITPQFVFTPPAGSALTAELNTDVDFTRFTNLSNLAPTVMGTTVINGTTYGTSLTVPSFFSIQNTAPGNTLPAASMWIDYASVSPSGAIQYTLTSAALEPGITAATGVTTETTSTGLASCPGTVNANGGVDYKCNYNPTAGLLNGHNLTITLNGTGQNNPTNWTFTGFSASGVCPTAYTPSVGSWYGGIEAIVPFVKAAAGYETYIKLFNRYNPSTVAGSPAKVYVANMNQVQASIVTSIKQLGAGIIKNSTGAYDNSAIPVNGFITITATDLGSTYVAPGAVANTAVLDKSVQNAGTAVIDGVTALPNGGGTELQQGVPIKFLIRVPAQMGSPAFTTQTVNTNAGVGNQTVVGTSGTANLTGSAAGVATASVVDPYITGFVVSTYTSGNTQGQRTVPLTFKSFKQGQYN